MARIEVSRRCTPDSRAACNKQSHNDSGELSELYDQKKQISLELELGSELELGLEL